MTTFWKPRHWAVPLLLVVALLCAGQAQHCYCGLLSGKNAIRLQFWHSLGP
jgi:hypothetical protein